MYTSNKIMWVCVITALTVKGFKRKKKLFVSINFKYYQVDANTKLRGVSMCCERRSRYSIVQ
jgi:hypothetical protein